MNINKSNIIVELKDFSIDVQPILKFDIIIPQVIYNGIKEEKATICSAILFFSKESTVWHFYAGTFSLDISDTWISDVNWEEKLNSMISKLNSMELTPSLNHSLFIVFETISEILERATDNEYGFLYFTKENKKIMKKATGAMINYNCKKNRTPFTRNN